MKRAPMHMEGAAADNERRARGGAGAETRFSECHEWRWPGGLRPPRATATSDRHERPP